MEKNCDETLQTIYAHIADSKKRIDDYFLIIANYCYIMDNEIFIYFFL